MQEVELLSNALDKASSYRPPFMLDEIRKIWKGLYLEEFKKIAEKYLSGNQYRILY